MTFRSVFLPPPLTEGLIAETPGAGEIMPQPFVYADGEVRLLDDIIGSGFLVVVSPAVDSADLARLKQRPRICGGDGCSGSTRPQTTAR